ncbi:kinase-like domain-containing protein [Cladorrhinum sp. PSN259]|nr:kinase-like domain-containing protein [Cladorrhinum sp. PSN259]
MDHFRLLSLATTLQEQQRDPKAICRGRVYILTVIDCAFPPIPATSENLYKLVEQRGEKMFFSQKKLRADFNEQVINTLLNCQCKHCVGARGGYGAGDPLADVRSKYAWLLFPLMIYLGKLHFVYPWLSAIELDKVNHTAKTHPTVHCDDIANLSRLVPNDIERMLFRSAYQRVLRMFNPFVFQLSGLGEVPHNNLVPHARFPYENERPLVAKQSASVTYFEVPAEYMHKSVKEKMKLYPSSMKDCPVEGKPRFRFVRKVLKLTTSEDTDESDVLRLVSQIKGDASENIITLLALYNWRHHIHYVFPYVESDLELVLRKGHFANDISESGNPRMPLPLPGQWLWNQMVGVAQALWTIHFGIRNPFPRDTRQVIAFHFDLRPQNILVTEDRKLKITDFGHSVMRIVDPGEEPSESFTRGDIKYFAPESWQDVEQILRTPDGSLRDKEVLLNYDVWSLACIMLEVLIFLLEGRTRALEGFDQERLAEKPPLPFFGLDKVKRCVPNKITSILHRFTKQKPVHDEVHDNYLRAVCRLVEDMFEFDKDKRIYSSEVTGRLRDAGMQYEAARDKQENKLRTAIMVKEVEDNDSFREVGWRGDDDVLLSFLDMAEVIVTQKDRSNPQLRATQSERCQLQVLYRPERQVDSQPLLVARSKTRAKPKLQPARFALKWAFELPNGEPSDIEAISIDTSQTQLIPTYVFEDPGADVHECSLFDGLRKNILLTFGFKSRRDAQAFQGALLQHKVIPAFPANDIIPKKVIWTDSKGNSFETPKPHIQFWMKKGPEYLSPQQTLPAGNTDAARPGLPSSSSSQGCAALAVFGSYQKLMLIPCKCSTFKTHPF